ncbi:MAG: hypothetical protein JST00_19070 [Deltaproteobacteria bacterium]|nr:hypothetical protein [Deltaproteobacteria bacterium]
MRPLLWVVVSASVPTALLAPGCIGVGGLEGDAAVDASSEATTNDGGTEGSITDASTDVVDEATPSMPDGGVRCIGSTTITCSGATPRCCIVGSTPTCIAGAATCAGGTQLDCDEQSDCPEQTATGTPIACCLRPDVGGADPIRRAACFAQFRCDTDGEYLCTPGASNACTRHGGACTAKSDAGYDRCQ